MIYAKATRVNTYTHTHTDKIAVILFAQPAELEISHRSAVNTTVKESCTFQQCYLLPQNDMTNTTSRQRQRAVTHVT